MPDKPTDEKPMTRFEAQRKLGLFAPHDFVTLGIIVLSLVTLFFWWLFGEPTLQQVLLVIGMVIVLLLMWIVLLCYRILVFQLDMQADINLMPETAARIVKGYASLGASSPRASGPPRG